MSFILISLIQTHITTCVHVHTPGGKEGLMRSMNPINPGVTWWKEPSLIVFFGWQPFVVVYAIFVGFHNPYAGDFGPFVSFHDGAFDFSIASKEWARLH